VDVTSEFEVSFYLGEETLELMGYNVTFSYDAGYLDLIEIEEGTLLSGSGEETFFHCDSSTAGIAEINGAVLGAVVQSPGIIFTATFRALAAGQTEVVIGESDLRDDENAQLSHTTEEGIVQITSVIDTEEYSWGAIKARFR
jgi:hypothetical protein